MEQQFQALKSSKIYAKGTSSKQDKIVKNNFLLLTDDDDDNLENNKVKTTNKILCTPSDEKSSDRKLVTKAKLSASFSQSLYISDSDETNCSKIEANKQRKDYNLPTTFSQELFSTDTTKKSKQKNQSKTSSSGKSECSVISISDSSDGECENNDNYYNEEQISNIEGAKSLNSTEMAKLNDFFDNVPSLVSPRLSCLKDRKNQEDEIQHVYVSETESESNDKENQLGKQVETGIQNKSRNIASQTTIANTMMEKSDSGNEKAKKTNTPLNIKKTKNKSLENDVLSQSKTTRKKDNSYVEKVNISAKIKINVQISTFDTDSSESTPSPDSSNKRKQKINVRNRVKIGTKNNRSTEEKSNTNDKDNKTLKNNCNNLKKNTAKPKESTGQNEDIINEDMEKILNDVYGQSWKTPAMLKKCASRTKAQPVNDDTHDFSLFHRDIPKELESTRIASPTKHNSFTRIQSQKDDTDYTSDESEASDRSESSLESEASSDWKCDGNVSTDSSSENFLIKRNTKPKSKTSKVRSVPEKAFPEKPKTMLRTILDTCEFKKKLAIPATPVSEKLDEKHSKRKLFTPKHRFLNYNSETEEIVTDTNKQTEELGKNDHESQNDFVKLKMPIPDFLQPTNDKSDELTKNNENPIKNSRDTPKLLVKKVVPTKAVSAKTYGFLQSLDVSTPKSLCHPDSIKFRNNYKAHKEELTKILYDLYNEKIFNNLLELPITWNKKLLNTAGRCFNIKKLGVRSCRIELSEKVLTSGDRLRCTLIHELCHAAAWIFEESNGHGESWKKWVRESNIAFPELPKISTCHQYEIEYKYTYQCSLCKAKYQTHSKSKKVENIRCSYCHGKIEVFLNKKDTNGQIVQTPVKKASGFALFVKEKYKDYKKPELKHADIMKILSNEFSSLSVEDKIKY